MSDDSRVSGNIAARWGGGIFNLVGTVAMTGSAEVSGNTADADRSDRFSSTGGGIYTLSCTSVSDETSCGIVPVAGVAVLDGAIDCVNVYGNDPDNIVEATDAL